MTESSEAYQRGAEKMREVYAGEVIDMPEGTMAFTDVMLTTLFSEVWTRTELPIRDRRLLIMGVIAANGSVETWKIQAKAALKRGELTAVELRETLIQLAPYAGFPNVAGLVAVTEGVIHEVSKEQSADK